MRLVVIGAGAMGSLFGAALQPDAEVTLLDTWQDHVDAINRDGLTVLSDNGERTVRVRAISSSAALGQCELAIIFVKSHQTAWAAAIAKDVLTSDGLALTLQNGLGNGETVAAAVGEGRTCVGVTAHGATLLGPGRIRHAGRGATHLGRSEATAERVAAVASLLRSAGFETHVSDDVRGLIWGKLVINAGINALTALMRVRNGALDQVDSLGSVMDAAVMEAAAVAAAEGIPLPYGDPVERVRSVCRATAANRSSMLQDVLRGQISENEVINGAIVREAAKVGVPVPVNRTIYNLVRGMEATYADRES